MKVFFGFLLSLSLLWGPAALAQDEDALRAALERIVQDKRLKDAKFSVHVRALDDGRTLYGKNEALRLNPASNMKIVTAAAALDHFGAAFTYTTEVWGDARGATVQGDLVLSGNGDPFLEWGHLLELAERVRRRGVREVTGDLVIDNSAFDDQDLPPAFGQKREDAAYRASTGAVAANFGAFEIIISPGEPGKPPSVSFDPPCDYPLVTNEATTLKDRAEAGKKPLTVELQADKGRTRVLVGGTTHAEGGATVRKRVEDPPLYTGYLFLRALETVGVTVKGKVRRGPRAPKQRALARHSSYTMPYLLAAMQKWSNNFMAEMLFKSLALGDQPATWAAAQEQVARFLDKAGIKRGDYKVTNGSGLYDANELSAAQLTQVLYYMSTRKDLFPDYEASFAIAGVDGTLGKRLRGPYKARARGKTGTLNQVSSLSGYAYTKGGRVLAYALIFNEAKGGAWSYRDAQDKFVEALIDNY
jgi:D-alanyl-D-alanine carboxypeptidase/D-alanyl-D-alanine-endopeptidase (penicillin-binding protein 4)